MKLMKTLGFVAVLALILACDSDDSPTNNPPVLEDRTMNMDENPTSDLLTTVTATDADEDTLTYAIISQTPANSVSINSVNGELYIMNASAFDYEQNTSIMVTISVTDGTDTTEATLTINILDVNENG
ncbi:cadherin repeat domain-containing protein [Hyunsoonleella rubra]|uniref:Cadherin repeat domain-containing protein n=1 Tax=Hyunsoonleella rubra TaxID=1737062 RepID=A0ABW5TBT6_9FLAO